MAAKNLAALEKAARDREIRRHLGERLRAYYASRQSAPVPDYLSKLIADLAKTAGTKPVSAQ